MRKVTPLLLAALTIFSMTMSASAAALSGSAEETLTDMKTALLILLAIAATFLVLSISLSASRSSARKRRRRSAVGGGTVALSYISLVMVVAVFLCSAMVYRNALTGVQDTVSTPSVTDPVSDPVQVFAPVEESTEAPTEEPTEAPTEDPRLSFAPAKTDLSDPANWEVDWQIIVNDEIAESYTREEGISFGEADEYFSLPGIATFRGNNYRNNATYGTAEITNKTLTKVWSHGIGTYNNWGGCAWTGQPLVVQWDEETKAIMNLYDSKKNKAALVEVIYATLDGNIHFYDLADGTETRDPIFMGMNFKGAGALDPRGYPLLYVGAGLYNNGKAPRMYVVSLIDGSILYEYGHNDSFAERNWTAFDSSPLVNAQTDTLIWPGESGVLYTIKLNTDYDKSVGTISVTPDTPVKARYSTAYSENGRYLGFESSVSIVDHYLYVSENGGMFYCVDLNTMELVWAQDTKDDSNSSPVFERTAPDKGYVYTAPSLHWTQDSSAHGEISIYKLDALTGEVVWKKPYSVYTVDGVSGGVQSSPLLGEAGTSLEGMILYTISRTNTVDSGTLVALDTDTGAEVWRWEMDYYAWSSPVAVYDEDGTAYVVVCDSAGYVTLLDGRSGTVLDSEYLGGLVEASPAVFEDMLVVGTRIKQICGVKIR